MVGLVSLPAAAIKAMVRVGIKEKLMGFAQAVELGVEPAHFVGRRILIELAEVALDRTANIRSQGCRRRAIAPLRVTAAAVEIHRGFEQSSRRRAEKSDAPAHAEADDAEPRSIRRGAALEKINRRIDVAHDVGVIAAIFNARRCLRGLGFALAVIELRREGWLFGTFLYWFLPHNLTISKSIEIEYYLNTVSRAILSTMIFW